MSATETHQDRDLERSFDRLDRSEEYRHRTIGYGGTRQGGALRRRYLCQLADKIGADRACPRDRKVWRNLKDIDDETLALRLLVAGISVCGNHELGANKDGEKNPRDIALWIGRNFNSRRELGLRLGAWGINLLLTLPVFALEGEILVLTGDVNDFMDDVIARAVCNHPLLSPLFAPPEPWTQVYRGGLPKDHWARVSLIRECHFSIENAAIKAISTGRMQRVLDAINALQQVPFTINKPVLEFIKQKSAPPVPDPSLPKHRQVEMQTRLEAWQQDIVLAEALCDRFYVPLNIDFRGRIYPIPHFAFTREDHVRALFLFADGAPIGEEGLLWLKAHVAARADGNSWSKVEKPSKLNRAGRIAWTEEHLGTLCKFGNAVLASDDPAKWKWVLPDDPWQFAAACVELTQAIDVGPSFVTRLPLNFDATCSGLQHLCLMTRAEEGRHVNLASSDEPDDFYQRVAYEVWRGNPALHDLMKNPFNRAIVKQPVMTYFYGSMPGGWSKSRGGRSLPYGMTAQICEVLENRQSTRYAKELATAIYRSIGAMAPKAAGVLHSLRRLSKLCAEHELPLRWTTPNGLPVINRYHDPIIKRIKVPVSGRSRFVNLAVGDKEGIAKAKAANAVTANFVHSADAAHLQLVAIATAKENIAIVSVHDCFASLAPHAARLNEIIRDQLIRMHKRYNWLNEIWESARRDLPKSVKLPPRPEIGDLDIEGVRDNQHAFN